MIPAANKDTTEEGTQELECEMRIKWMIQEDNQSRSYHSNLVEQTRSYHYLQLLWPFSFGFFVMVTVKGFLGSLMTQ